MTRDAAVLPGARNASDRFACVSGFVGMAGLLFRSRGGIMAGLFLLPLVIGCAGGGTVKIMPLMRSDLADAEPLISDVPLSQAFYWVEESGEVNVALRYHAGSLLGKPFDATWEMTMTLEGMPAGSSRLYKLKSERVHVAQNAGGARRRACGGAGVAVLHAPEGRRLRGRFHVQVRQQQFTLLNGWSPAIYAAPTLIMAGEFTAIEDAARGREIRERTSASTTRPASASLTR